MRSRWKALVMVACAALLPACSTDADVTATAGGPPPVQDVADSRNPYPPGAETPTLWTVGQWRDWNKSSK